MKENDVAQIQICPRCGRTYRGHPAVSRADNKTLICPECGTREALASIGVKPEEQERILTVMKKYRAGDNKQ